MGTRGQKTRITMYPSVTLPSSSWLFKTDCRPFHTRLLDALGLAGVASCKNNVCSLIGFTSLLLLLISSTIFVTIRSRSAATLQEQALVDVPEAPEVDLPKPSFTPKVLSWFCFGNDKQTIVEDTVI